MRWRNPWATPHIVPVNQGLHLVPFPQEITPVALLGWLQHKAQARIVALVLDAGETPSSAFEAHAAGEAQTDPIEGVIGPRGEGLREHRIQMLRDPVHPQGGCGSMQRRLREAIALPKGSKGRAAFLWLGPRNGTCHLPGGVCPHAAQALQPFREHGIIQSTTGFQMPTDAPGLSLIHDEGQFQQERRRPGTWFCCLWLTLWWLFLAHTLAV